MLLLIVIGVLCVHPWPAATVAAAAVAGSQGGRRLQASAGVTDLATIQSPFTSTTAGVQNAFTGCGSSAGHVRRFFVVVSPGIQITIGQTSNSFDSKHSAFWSESAEPGSYLGSAGGGGSGGGS